MSDDDTQRAQVGWLVAGDGERLALRTWTPSASPLGVVVIAHGLGEHSGRFGRVAAVLNDAGLAVVAADHRGHGNSPGKRGHAEWSQLLGDLARVVEHARAAWPGLPVLLYGHSLGGALVVRYAQRNPEAVAAVVASAPAFRPAFEPPAWKLAAARLLHRLWPSLTMHNELDLGALSRDPDVVDAFLADPLTHDRISVGLALGALAAGEAALRDAAALRVPTLIVHGDADRLTSFAASRSFAAAAGEQVELLAVEGGYHEPHNDPGHEGVVARLAGWLGARARQRRDSVDR